MSFQDITHTRYIFPENEFFQFLFVLYLFGRNAFLLGSSLWLRLPPVYFREGGTLLEGALLRRVEPGAFGELQNGRKWTQLFVQADIYSLSRVIHSERIHFLFYLTIKIWGGIQLNLQLLSADFVCHAAAGQRDTQQVRPLRVASHQCNLHYQRAGPALLLRVQPVPPVGQLAVPRSIM